MEDKPCLVVVASQNPVKLQAVQKGFERMFPTQRFELHGVSAPSGVSDQPASDSETLRGAMNRARAVSQAQPQADYWVGVEGGIEEQDGEMAAFAWIVVLSRQGMGKGRTGTFFLPPRVAGLIRQGMELGEADDIVFGRSNSKQENGAIGLLTGNAVDRAQLYEQAVVLALTPFKNPALYL
ncbi:MAG: inosine/xanthosine triphosphatase [Anaerolineales bacterium]|nr:inosine/xanthosine triphosphatase [Anaerolineales bacterium]